jgi:hypothetical protein
MIINNDELLNLLTPIQPFRFVDVVQNIETETIRGTLNFNGDNNRCYTACFEMWTCIEMLAQLAEIHNRWLWSRTIKRDGLLVKVDDFTFFACPPLHAGLIVLEARRGNEVTTFLKYNGTVSHNNLIVANGAITIYNNEVQNAP